METILIKTLQFLLSLSLLVALHEGGHFLFAKLFKTRVSRFYLFANWGFHLFSTYDDWFRRLLHRPLITERGDEGQNFFQWVKNQYFAMTGQKDKIKTEKIGNKVYKPEHGTEYGIGWLPIGGYVSILGMIDETNQQLSAEPQPWEFRSKPAWQRLLIMLGGVLMNFLVAFFIVLWAFRNTIFGIFGMNAPRLEGGIRNAMQAKGFRDMTNALKESVRNESNGQDSEGKVRVARPSSEGGNPMTGTVGENAVGTDENPIVTRPVAERADEKPDTPMDANELKSKEDEEGEADKTNVPQILDQYGRPLEIEENAEEAEDRATVNSEETAPDVPFETREDANGEERPASQGLSDMSDEELEKQWDRDDLTDETRKEIATEQKSRADEQKRQVKEDKQKAKKEAAIQKRKAKEREKAEFSVMDKKEKAQYVAKKTVNSTGGRATLKAMKGTGKAAETVLKGTGKAALKGTGKAAKHTGSAISYADWAGLKSQKKYTKR